MFQTVYGKRVIKQEIDINHIQCDSKRVQQGDLFVAIRGSVSDGHRYVHEAISNGAIAVAVENDAEVPDALFMASGVTKIVVSNTRIALAQISARYFDLPANKMTIIAVTGTNGKTTTTHLLETLLNAGGRKTALMGTIAYKIENEMYQATHTTPAPLELHSFLARMVERGCSTAIMEVSSHALHQHRVFGFDFKAAVFTNLTKDHLDYHGSMLEYFNAKKILFDQLQSEAWAIINVDDEWGKRLCTSTRARTFTYGMDYPADVFAKNVSLSMMGTSFTIVHDSEETPIESSLVGRFNVSNILAAFGTGIVLGIPKSTLQSAIRNCTVVKGRFERIVAPEGWIAIIDYAHTPDALEKVLRTINDLFDGSKGGRIITVFGCGGDRDRMKRPMMARIATSLSTLTIVTSDNPRTEDPGRIIDDVMAGVTTKSKVYREQDRRKAIIMALECANAGDIILIAGKGHESFQIIGDQKVPFSDREIVEDFLHSHA